MIEITAAMISAAVHGYGERANPFRMRVALEAALASHDHVVLEPAGAGPWENRVFGPMTQHAAKQLAESMDDFVQETGGGYALKLRPPSSAPGQPPT